jgi:DNA-directed RNA polymerase
MSELLTQQEVEDRMYYGGVARAERMMSAAEDQGRAHQNPYAKAIFRDYVLPLAAAIRTELDVNRPGRRQAHAALLKPLDPEAVAFLAVRAIITGCMQGGERTHRQLADSIGAAVHNELVLAQIEESHPELYHTLSRDLGRRLSKDERHRMTVFKMQAKKAGYEWAKWDLGSRHQVGMYLLGVLAVAGLVDLEPQMMVRGKPAPRAVTLAFEVLEQISRIKAYVAISSPMYGPCVEPPLDWVGNFGGGFHTEKLRRQSPSLVRCTPSARPLYRDLPMPVVCDAVNALQRTAWRVNGRILDAVRAVSGAFCTDEIVTLVDLPKPSRPDDIPEGAKAEDMTEDQLDRFKKWKRSMAEWYTERKLRGVKYGRFYSATRTADQFRPAPRIYFVYFADSRGRLYPMTYGINPQGSDLQKALLEFAEGKPLDTPEAIRWFHVQGANKWGFDKATLEQRHAWVVERQDILLSFAADPLNNRGWTDADNPLQFLAWCFEYADWVNDNTGEFVSRLPISMDGSCNGLQNLSAMLRDEIGGQATNLTANTVMEDIYRRVAEGARQRLAATVLEDPVKESLRQRWLAHGIERSVVKRSVMTTPYGVTQRSATDYVVDDYLRHGKAPCFDKTEYRAAAQVLMAAVWPAIGDVVVKGSQAMAWLKKSARRIVKAFPEDQEPVISWPTPSGFLASQAYFEADFIRVHTRLAGAEKIRVAHETDDPDIDKHANGLAPNFVHSMDASHLHLTAAAASKAGIASLAMIHDDYGTHAADAQALYEIIREQFVRMYETHDPVNDFRALYPDIDPPPEKGLLDIAEVRRSQFFFS